MSWLSSLLRFRSQFRASSRTGYTLVTRARSHASFSSFFPSFFSIFSKNINETLVEIFALDHSFIYLFFLYNWIIIGGILYFMKFSKNFNLDFLDIQKYSLYSNFTWIWILISYIVMNEKRNFKNLGIIYIIIFYFSNNNYCCSYRNWSIGAKLKLNISVL